MHPRSPRHCLPSLSAAVLVAALAATLPAPPVAALDSLDDVACACADDVLGIGDYVSCFSHLSRRLVAHRAITRDERQDALRNAHLADLDAVAGACPGGDAGEEPAGWGVSLGMERAFYEDPTVLGEADTVRATLRLWNFTGDDVFQTNLSGAAPTRGCLYEVLVREPSGLVVHREAIFCPTAIEPVDLPAGTLREETFDLVLDHELSALGFPDGTPLEAGAYQLEVRWLTHGPQAEDPGADGVITDTQPSAVITLRIGEP